MNSSSTLQKLLDRRGQAANGNSATQAVQWQEGMNLTLHVNGDSLTMLAEIIDLRADPQDDILLRKLLAHAFPGLRLRRGALTINPDENTLVYSYEHDFLALDKTRFENLLANFAETTQELRNTAQRLRYR
ncbi:MULTISPECIES: CesT family type III secretion system chaperone [Pseudomonas]|nr:MULTISPECIES: CesT family type III secretion system chaperone [Pseudomonas]MCK9702156.1 CesT family type III secretion system chaperone [Pseudomonas syringae pv. syringae]MCK9717494.1 CesT family type III secretion system chaperone [Pseudomonas syringae pv. syringae]MCK9720987.1 CesT family type III secretion system chaperone [Pseudomonas syringae pv. syringae]MCK9757833.1 CesT family type III secretion system chaperone [Pseudomonas syringae pv. syringae]MCK9761124.1 CesT family type III se